MGFSPYIHIPQFWPTRIGGCVLWLRSDLGITKDGSDLVSAWADQSGAGNDATQGTAANKPTWLASQVNGYPALQFNIAGETNYAMAFASAFLAAPCTMAAVVKGYDAGVGDVKTLLTCGAPGYINYAVEGTATNNWGFYRDGWINTSYSAGGASYHFIGAQETTFNNIKCTTDNNAAETITSGTGYYTGITQNWFGNDQWNEGMIGYITEVICYNTVLSDANFARVKNYINRRYALWAG